MGEGDETADGSRRQAGGLPRYAYLPGRNPHPVRDPSGHSYGGGHFMPGPSDQFRWGAALFNHGYYWEAHEAWEDLWRDARDGSARRHLFKGLILLAAAGLKAREAKSIASARHAARATKHLLLAARLYGDCPDDIARGLAIGLIARRGEADVAERAAAKADLADEPLPFFSFEI
jgi:Domain of unknown function (DUF309).